MTELQNELLKMFKWLVRYLDENSIKYYVIGGTFLGAVRHKGFIPWDDDIDIGVPREDYKRLIATFNPSGTNYVLETPYDNNPDFLYTFSKLYNTGTTLVEHQKHNLKRGIFIDIFPLDGAGKTTREVDKIYKPIFRKNMLLVARTCAIRKERKWYKNLAICFSRLIPFLNDKKLSLAVDKMMSSVNLEESLFIANYGGSYGKREIVEKSVFGDGAEYDFESIKVKGPVMFNEYLTSLYGDWRQLPPVEKRGIKHDNVSIDLNKSYLDVE